MVKKTTAQMLFKKVFSFLGMAVFVCVLACSSFAVAQEDLNDDYDDLVLAVLVDREVVSAGMFAVQKGDKIYLPVSGLASLYGIFTKTNNGIVTGFLFSEENSFEINTQAPSITVKGQTTGVFSDSFFIEDDGAGEVYMEMSLFEAIWPILLNIRLDALVLYTEPTEEIPYQFFAERQKRRNGFREKEDEEKVPKPFLAYPYQLYSKPASTCASGSHV